MRVTRAKARLANEQASQANSASPKSPPKQERAPLNDITEVTQNTSKDLVVDFTGTSLHSIKPSLSKGKVLNELSKHSEENIPEILDDDNESDSSSAVDEACEELLRPINGFEVYQIPMHDHDRALTPPSRAVLRARRRLSPKSHTPRFDPNIHKSPAVQRSPTKAQARLDVGRRDSILDIIDSRTPLKISQPPATLNEYAAPELQEQDEGTGSPTRSMASPVNSPATPRLRKRASRIEDSLAAIDDQEDALDEAQKSLAIVAKQRSENALRESYTFQQNSSPLELRSSPTANRMSSHLACPSAKPATPVRETSLTKPLRPRPRSTLYEPTAASARAATPKKDTKSVGSTLRTSMKPISTPRSALAATRQALGPARLEARKAVSANEKAGEGATVRFRGRQDATPSDMQSVNAKGPLSIAAARSSSNPGAMRKSTGLPPEVRLTAAARARLDVLKREKTRSASNLKTRQVTRPSIIPSAATKPTTASTIRAAQTQLGDLQASPKRVEPLGYFKKTPVKPCANTPVKRSGSVRSVTELPAANAQSSMKRTASTILTTPRKTAADSSLVTSEVPLEDKLAAAKRARAEAAERGRLASQQWAEKMKKRQSLDPSDEAIEAR